MASPWDSCGLCRPEVRSKMSSSMMQRVTSRSTIPARTPVDEQEGDLDQHLTPDVTGSSNSVADEQTETDCGDSSTRGVASREVTARSATAATREVTSASATTIDIDDWEAPPLQRDDSSIECPMDDSMIRLDEDIGVMIDDPEVDGSQLSQTLEAYQSSRASASSPSKSSGTPRFSSPPHSPTSSALSQFAITLTRKCVDDKAGVDVDYGDGKTLKVRKLKKGLVSAWNESFPALPVEAGDAFVQINGKRNHSKDLLKELTTAPTMHVIVRKAQHRLAQASSPLHKSCGVALNTEHSTKPRDMATFAEGDVDETYARPERLGHLSHKLRRLPSRRHVLDVVHEGPAELASPCSSGAEASPPPPSSRQLAITAEASPSSSSSHAAASSFAAHAAEVPCSSVASAEVTTVSAAAPAASLSSRPQGASSSLSSSPRRAPRAPASAVVLSADSPPSTTSAIAPPRSSQAVPEASGKPSKQELNCLGGLAGFALSLLDLARNVSYRGSLSKHDSVMPLLYDEAVVDPTAALDEAESPESGVSGTPRHAENPEPEQEPEAFSSPAGRALSRNSEERPRLGSAHV